MTTTGIRRNSVQLQRNPALVRVATTMKWAVAAVALLSCAAADPMQTLLEQTIALIDCDPTSSQIGALDAETADIVATQHPDGRWPDVNYTDTAASAWATAIHLQRTLLLATVARCPASRFHGSATVTSAAALAAE